MTKITFEDGKVVFRDGKVGTEQSCCCGPPGCCPAGGSWELGNPAIKSGFFRNVGGGFPPLLGGQNVELVFESDCGSGAAGTVDVPTSVSPCDYEGLAGAVQSVTLTSGGTGYARLGRVAPTVTVSGTGDDADLEVNLTQLTEDEGCPLDYWAVKSVTVNDGGTGYTEGEDAVFTIAEGDAEVFPAVGRIYTAAVAPDVTLSVSSADGSGAVLSANWQETDPQSRAAYTCPPSQGQKRFEIASVSIDDGGSGYSVGEVVAVAVDDGTAVGAASLDVDAVDGNGAITAVSALDAGVYYKDTGSIELVEVYKVSDSGTSCSEPSGNYYREDATVPPYVFTPTVNVVSYPPFEGSGAVVTAVVDEDPASETFGQVVDLVLEEGGEGYLNPPACEPLGTVYVSLGSASFEFELGGESDGALVNCDPSGLLENVSCDEEQLGQFAYLGSTRAFTEGCGCDDDVHVTVSYSSRQYLCTTNLGPRQFVDINGAETEFCFRLEKDEEGCLTGEATLAVSDVGDVPDFDCWPPGTPTVSLMPP
jgi:hypothetical protein